MRRFLLPAVMTAALATTAGAEVSETGVFGYWTTFAGVATDGKPVCGMSTDWTAATFVIKYFGGDGIVVDIGRVGWRVPFGQPVRVLIQIDQAPIMEVLSHGAGEEGKGWSVLEFAIRHDDVWDATGKKAIDEFFALLASGRRITVSFPEGSERPWVGQLAGSRSASQSFIACGTTIDAATNGAPGATQPFSPKEAPQPVTTQPFHRL